VFVVLAGAAPTATRQSTASTVLVVRIAALVVLLITGSSLLGTSTVHRRR
jgi:hypothetical protein